MNARELRECADRECGCRERHESQEARLDTAQERQGWRASQRFETWARRALAAEGVEFREWLVLEALDEIRDPTKEGIYQIEVARHLGASERVVSYWMAVLDHKAWVDRGPGEDPRQWSVLLTDLGRQALMRCRQRLAAGQKRARDSARER